jgi:hypothetical protein
MVVLSFDGGGGGATRVGERGGTFAPVAEAAVGGDGGILVGGGRVAGLAVEAVDVVVVLSQTETSAAVLIWRSGEVG